MAILDISNPSKTERFLAKTDETLIKAVQERAQLLKQGIEESAIFRAADRALGELIRRYDRWLWKEVRRFPTLDLDDAYSYALRGFQKAIDSFDLTGTYTLVGSACIVVRRSITLLFYREGREAEKERRYAVVAPLQHEDELIDPYEVEQRGQQMAALQDEVKLLKLDRQKVIELRQAGMPWAEIGALFGKTDNAVRAIYSRALARIATRLQDAKPIEVVEIVEPIEIIETPVVKPSWMKQLWTRFKKTVRFSKNRDISGSPSKLPGSLPCLLQPPKLRPLPPGSPDNASRNGPLTYWLRVPLRFMRSCRLEFSLFHSTDSPPLD